MIQQAEGDTVSGCRYKRLEPFRIGQDLEMTSRVGWAITEAKSANDQRDQSKP